MPKTMIQTNKQTNKTTKGKTKQEKKKLLSSEFWITLYLVKKYAAVDKAFGWKVLLI